MTDQVIWLRINYNHQLFREPFVTRLVYSSVFANIMRLGWTCLQMIQSVSRTLRQHTIQAFIRHRIKMESVYLQHYNNLDDMLLMTLIVCNVGKRIAVVLNV